VSTPVKVAVSKMVFAPAEVATALAARLIRQAAATLRIIRASLREGVNRVNLRGLGGSLPA
jgi:hypothetical protein